MKNGALVFVLTLILFAAGTSAIAFTLAMDAAKIPTRVAPQAQNIPWFCVRLEPPTGSAQITPPPPPIGTRGKPVGPTISIDANPGKISRIRPIVIKESSKPVKAKPDLPKQTSPKPVDQKTNDRVQTPGYNSGNSGGTSGSSGGGSMISKNDGGAPATPGYYNNGTSGTSNNADGTLSIILPNGSSSSGLFDNAAIYKYVSACPSGYIANLGPICVDILTKKLSGKLTAADYTSPAYSMCLDIMKPGVWNSKATPELCQQYYKYANQCSASQGKVCMLEKFVTESGIPTKEVLKMIDDLANNCWAASN
jgi:hypothetical protein